MKHNNKGFSLVELIVVIAIIGALSVAFFGTVTTALNARSKKTAEIIYNALSECKSRNLSGQDCYLILRYDSTNKNYCYDIKNTSDNSLIDTKEIGNSKLVIKLSDKKASDYNLKFTFDTKTAVLSASYGSTAITSGNNVEIKISGVGKSRTVKIARYTGYIYNIIAS